MVFLLVGFALMMLMRWQLAYPGQPSFFAPGGAASSGWTSYPPLADIATAGQTFWLAGMVLLITSSLLGSINFITTVVQLRAPGLSFLRLPFFVWAQLVTAFLLLLAFPPLEAAAVLQLMDRLAGTSFFLPGGLVAGGQPLAASGGGSPLLWQHLFWFLAHPEVYVLILPAMGIVAEVIANNSRKPLWGYRLMVGAAVFLGFMSLLVWAHHMFLPGMGTTMSAFFRTTTMIISPRLHADVHPGPRGLAWSIWKGRRVDDNPWRATTLEWATASPPPHGNFAAIPTVYRGPYEYSVPGADRDYVGQNDEC